MAVTYGGATSYYATNIQGDVVAILNSSGAAVVTYTYDAWGNILTTTGTQASTLGTHNPLRYRGYVYDQETGLYYLQSRYYNPALGRFICAASLVSTGQGILGNNMFAYCLNNSVNCIDPTGACPHDGRFYTSGPFEGQFEYNPGCELCAAHGEFWVSDKLGNHYDLTNHELHTYEQMAICTDGGNDPHNSATHQKETSYSIKGKYMDPTKIRYVVAPVGYQNVSNGDLALVIDNTTGKSVFAIVGDRGPLNMFNEVSMLVAWDLGYRWADGSRGPKENFSVLYFPGTRYSWQSINDLAAYLS